LRINLLGVLYLLNISQKKNKMLAGALLIVFGD